MNHEAYITADAKQIIGLKFLGNYEVQAPTNMKSFQVEQFCKKT